MLPSASPERRDRLPPGLGSAQVADPFGQLGQQVGRRSRDPQSDPGGSVGTDQRPASQRMRTRAPLAPQPVPRPSTPLSELLACLSNRATSYGKRAEADVLSMRDHLTNDHLRPARSSRLILTCTTAMVATWVDRRPTPHLS